MNGCGIKEDQGREKEVAGGILHSCTAVLPLALAVQFNQFWVRNQSWLNQLLNLPQ